MEDTPTSKALGVFIGMTEINGTAETTQPVTSVLAERTCVFYQWSVEESWSDKEGDKKKSGWICIAGGGEINPFYLQDDTGVILVRPGDAKLNVDTFFEETVGPGDPLYYSQGGTGKVAKSDFKRKYREYGVPLHAPVYVIGPARERTDLVAPEIAADKLAPLFLISTKDEQLVKAGIGGSIWRWGIAGLVFSCFPWLALGATQSPDRPPHFWPLILVSPLLYVGAWCLGWVWLVYNGIVGLRHRVLTAWSLIDVQLKRRHDLIPQLVAVVEGLGAHEREVQSALARLRAQFNATAPGLAGPDFAGLAASVRGIAEKYPQLIAHKSFTALQKELIQTEERIALARAYYNNIATELANRLETVPDGWVAKLRGLRPEPLFQAADFERPVVRVDLA